MDSYTRTQPEPSQRVILDNAHFRTNAMRTEMIDVRSCSLPSDFPTSCYILNVFYYMFIIRLPCLNFAVYTVHMRNYIHVLPFDGVLS